MIEAGSEITVKRTSGDMERGWFMGTDLSRRDGSASVYTAPEAIACWVIKPENGATIDQVMAGEASYMDKTVSLTELLEWNQPQAA